MQTSPDSSRPMRLLAGLAVVAALYFVREVLIPTALAVLLTFLLLPLVHRFERARLNRVWAVVVTVLIASGITGGVTVLVGKQVLDLTLKLPDYRYNLREKARSLRQSGEGPIARLLGTIKELQQELSATQPARPGAKAASPDEQPVKVEVAERGPDVTIVAATILKPLAVVIAYAVITTVLLIFFLLYGEDLLARLVSLAGMQRVRLTASATAEIAERVGKYLRAQLLINLGYGTMLGLGLAFFGVPNALLWAVTGFVVRFIPYIGPWIAGVLPTLMTIAVFPGWSRALGVIGLFAVVEFITNMILEPWIYGTSSGISSLGVIVASIFWAWLWGPIGLILAVPVSVCLVVSGKYVPQLSTLHHLFGADADVPEPLRLYQHLLAGDADSADEVISEATKEKPLAEVCDELLVPVLSELKRELGSRAIDLEQAERVVETLEMTISSIPPAGATSKNVRVVCLPGQNLVDQCAARMLATTLSSAGVAAQALAVELLANEAAERTQQANATHTVVLQVPPVSYVHSRRLIVTLAARLDESTQIYDLSAGAEGPPQIHRSGDPDLPQLHHANSFARVVAEITEKASISREQAAPARA